MAAPAYQTSSLKNWVLQVLKNQGVIDCEVSCIGTTDKGDGYLGDISFIRVTTKKADGKSSNYDMIVKTGKPSQELRNKFPVRIAFEREIHMYSRVFPSYERLLAEKNLGPLDFIAKCFGTLITENTEVVFCQDLKAIGYELHPRTKSFNVEHLKLTMKTYGKWHAISFAMRDQKPEEFKQLSKLQCVWTAFSDTELFPPMLEQIETQLYRALEENNETELLRQLKAKVEGRFLDTWNLLIDGHEEQSVITHGDCWNNNFMFKYNREDESKSSPTNVMFLDFQLSKLGSPVLDLAYHLSAVCSETEFARFDELLNVYYQSFADTLRKLGSDPEQLFPYSALLTQWRKYSLLGIYMAGMVLPINLIDKSDVMNVEDLDGESYKDMCDRVSGKHKAYLNERLVAVIRHILKN